MAHQGNVDSFGTFLTTLHESETLQEPPARKQCPLCGDALVLVSVLLNKQDSYGDICLECPSEHRVTGRLHYRDALPWVSYQ